MPEPKQSFDAVIYAPFGAVGIRMRSDAVSAIELRLKNSREMAPRSAAARAAVRALENYFRSPNASVEVPVWLDGTPFQRRVWRALQGIPAGKRLTYGELAAKLKTSARAVGGACRSNPVPIIVPCHRVVAAQGPGGFMGATRGRAVDIKTWLLGHEARKESSERR